jgi:molecular chaperone GrpE
VAAVLADFQNWLAALPPARLDATPPPQPEVDLHTLLSQFIALRHEVNLQTKAVRAQQEQNGETLQQLEEAFASLHQTQSVALQQLQQSLEERLRPMLKTLTDLYDSLALPKREMERMQEDVLRLLQQLSDSVQGESAPPPEPPAPLRRSFWARWFGPAVPDVPARATQLQAERELQERKVRQAREVSERIQQVLTSLLTGYTMSLQRVERALKQHSFEVIPTVGQRFDPEIMEALEAVPDSGRPSGEVVEEVRRGYLWNGRVFRYAQVRVAKS